MIMGSPQVHAIALQAWLQRRLPAPYLQLPELCKLHIDVQLLTVQTSLKE